MVDTVPPPAARAAAAEPDAADAEPPVTGDRRSHDSRSAARCRRQPTADVAIESSGLPLSRSIITEVAFTAAVA